MFTNEKDFETIISIRKMVLINSASYRLFETKLDDNLYISGSNNVGKTSILNALQLLLIPEENLMAIDKKFMMSSKKDTQAKNHTAEETYKYYFPYNTSLIVFEIENKDNTFLVVLYGKKANKQQYNRVIIPTVYDDIKDFLIDDFTQEPFGKDIHQLKEYVETKGIKSIELSTKEEIITTLFQTKKDYKRNPYNIVPLKDKDKKSLAFFQTLFKNFFTLGNMNLQKKIELIAELIKNKEKDENQELIQFDLESTKRRYQNIVQNETKINILRDYECDYEKLIDFEKTKKDKKNELIYNFVKLYNIIEKNIKDVEIAKKDNTELLNLLKTQEAEQIEKKKELDVLKTTLVSEKRELKKELDDNIKNYAIIQTHLSFYKPIDEFENMFVVDNVIKQTEDKISELKEHINKIEFELDNLKKEEDAQIYYQKLENEIKKQDRYIKNEEYRLNNFNLSLLGKLSDEEKIVAEAILHSNVCRLMNLSDETISSIKNFLALFKLNQSTIIVDGNELEAINYNKAIDLELEYDKLNKLIKDKEAMTVSDHIEIVEFKRTKNEDLINSKNLIENKRKLIGLLSNFNSIKEIMLSYSDKIEEKEKEIELNAEELKVLDGVSKKTMEEKADTSGKFSKIQNELDNLFKTKEKLVDNNEIHLFIGHRIENMYFNKETLVDKMILVDTEYDRLKDEMIALNNEQSNIYGIIEKYNNSKFFDGVELKTRNELRNNEDDYNKLVSIIKSEYDSLSLLENETLSEKAALQEDTNSSIKTLEGIVKKIQNFERSINNEFKKIKISNLKAVEFSFEIFEQLTSVLKDWFNKDSEMGLEYYEVFFKKVNEFLLNTKSSNNAIDIKDLIKNIKYEIIYDDDSRSETQQSNGTETMINIIFLNILINQYYEEGSKLKLPVILDELLNIDSKNLKNILHEINEFGSVLVGATTTIQPDIVCHFENCVDIGLQSENIMGNLQYIVSFKSPLLITLKD